MSEQTFRGIVTGMLEHGPVVVLADGRHPANGGLSEREALGTVVLQLAGDEGRAALEAGFSLTTCTGDEHGSDAEVTLGQDAVFGLVGLRPDGTPGLLTHGELPTCLGGEPQAALQQLLETLGIAPRQGWMFGVDQNAVQSGEAALEPDKRAAFLRAREAHDGSVWVLARAGVAGTEPPAAHARVPAFGVRVMPGTPGLSIEADALRWTELTPQGAHHVTLPWAAVGVVQSPDYQLGWAWIDDLPADMDEDPRFGALRHLGGGVPIQPPPLPPYSLLALPHQATAAQAVRRAAALGGVVLIDRLGSGVQVPRGLEIQHIVAVPLATPPQALAFLEEDDGFIATMPDASGRLGLVKAPWRAVLVVTVSSLMPRAYAFHDNASDALLQTLPATGVQGQQKFSFDQPVGPQVAEGQPHLHIEYVVQRSSLH